MRKSLESRPRLSVFARMLVVSALLLAGYAGMQLAPIVHSATTSISSHSLLVDTCPTGSSHC